MDVFRVVKDNVTARQVAEYYGMKISRNGMACTIYILAPTIANYYLKRHGKRIENALNLWR